MRNEILYLCGSKPPACSLLFHVLSRRGKCEGDLTAPVVVMGEWVAGAQVLSEPSKKEIETKERTLRKPLVGNT